MKIDVLNLNAEKIKEIEVKDEIFNFPIREDIVLRDLLRIQSNRRQPYGTDKLAGLRTSAHYHGRRRPRRPYVTQMGTGRARHQRIHGKAPPHMLFAARIAPNVVKGRRAHPPRAEKIWKQKINKKERDIAIISAGIATLIKDFVRNRGHKIDELKFFPIVIADDELKKIKKTKEFKEFLVKIGLEKELERIIEKKKRAGKGKMRGRRYRKRRGILIILNKKDDIKEIRKKVRNLNVEVAWVQNLNSELLAPGARLGRLVIWEESALKSFESRVLTY